MASTGMKHDDDGGGNDDGVNLTYQTDTSQAATLDARRYEAAARHVPSAFPKFMHQLHRSQGVKWSRVESSRLQSSRVEWSGVESSQVKSGQVKSSQLNSSQVKSD
mmetsp:Transcript_19134/g.32884  ORF Transcript_19134/g.32884 Transcript_19134/m.32884 type:complete len:106 (-) Transcript_19134:465-782(-)